MGLGMFFGLTGLFGRIVRSGAGTILGEAKPLVPLALLAVGYVLVRGRPREEPVRVAIGSLFVTLSAAGLLHLRHDGPPFRSPLRVLRGAGGVVGMVVAEPLQRIVATWGAVIVLTVFGMLGVLILIRLRVRDAVNRTADGLRPVGTFTKRGVASLFTLGSSGERDERASARRRHPTSPARVSTGDRRATHVHHPSVGLSSAWRTPKTGGDYLLPGYDDLAGTPGDVRGELEKPKRVRKKKSDVAPDPGVIDLVAADGDRRSGWDGVAAIPAEHAVRGLHSITMNERLLDPTAAMLTELLGMGANGESGGRSRFQMAGGEAGALVDLTGGARERGYQAGGTVHHVAFRAPDLPTMNGWRQQLLNAGVSVTEILDRQYFKSIYFREPGGVLFEIATDSPGFDIDEPLLELGKSLKLPPWLEPSREQIARALPPIELPNLSSDPSPLS